MSGWDDTGAAASSAGDGWTDGAAAASTFHGGPASNNGFEAGGDGFNGGNDAGGGDDRTCRICNQTDHLARECPDKASSLECYNCSQMGHVSADCTNEKVERPFTGTCNGCGVEGHRLSDCPDKAPEKCRACGQDGHRAINCVSKRTQLFEDAPTMIADEAWAAMKAADATRDMDDFRIAFNSYCKALDAAGQGDSIKMSELEQGFRSESFTISLIAKAKKLEDNFTYVSPLGVPGQKYSLIFNWGFKPKRSVFAAGWPKDAEENLARLDESGFPIPTMVPKCDNCDKLGHIRKHCKEEKAVNAFEHPKIMCAHCGKEGHRARNCDDRPVELCRNCKQPGHKKEECTNPRSAEGVECNVCNEVGHFSRDCPTKPKFACRNCGEEGHKSSDCTNERNPDLIQCHNCEKTGHMSRDCPEPKDWGKHRCRDCGELGHGPKRCPQAKAAPAGGDDGGFGAAGDNGFDDAPSAVPAGGDPGWSAAYDGPGGVSIEAGGW